MTEPTLIPFNPVVPFHGDVKSFAMSGPIEVISLGFIERDLATIGTEVIAIWGSPGSRQKEIPATVARFPYLQVERNDKIDVEAIPRLVSASAR
jgi:hypothetical protein